MSEGGLAGTAFVDLVPRFGAGFGAGLASKLKSLAAPAAVVGIGAGLFTIGEKFEKTFNAIKVQTGATGGVFEQLRDDAKNVLKGTAGSFDQVGAAIGGVYQRTRLTGPALEDLAKKQVTLARITKTDVAANVETTTALFGRYGIAVGDQSDALDVLFKASQQGGKGLAELVSTMQKGAPALTAFGFGFEKSAALVAALQRAGINVAPVLTGLRTGFGKIAKEGKDPQRVLAAIFKELRDGKDPTKATADAIKLFGARGGKELSDAVRSGRFDVDALLKTITDGKGGIIETGKEVSTIGGKFARLKNIVLVALEPIATKLVEVANVGVGKLVDGVTAAGPIVGAVFGFISDKASALGDRLAPTFDRIRAGAKRAFGGARDVIANFGNFVHGDGAGIGVAIGRIFGFQEDSTQTAGIIRAAQATRDELGKLLTGAREVGAGIGKALGNVDFGAIFASARQALGGVVDAIRGIDFGTIFGRLLDIVRPILPPLRDLAKAVIDLAVAAFPVLVDVVGDVVSFGIKLKPVFVGIAAIAYVLARVAGVVLAGALKVVAVATQLLAHHAGILRPILLALVGGFVALKVVRGVQAGILGAARAAGTAYGTFARLGGQAKLLFRSGSDTLRLRLWQVRDGASKVGGALKTAGTAIAGLAKSAFQGAVALARTVAGFVAQKAAALASAIATKAMAAAQWLLNAAMDANPVVLIVAGIAALAAGVILAYKHFKPFRDVVDAVGRALRTVAKVITGGLAAAFDWIKGHWKLLGAILLAPIVGPIALIVLNFKRITGAATAVVKGITGIFTRLPALIGRAVSGFGSILVDAGKAIIGGLATGARAALGLFIDIYVKLPARILGALAGAAGWLLHVGADIIGGLWRGARSAWSAGFGFLTGLAGRVLHGLGNVAGWLLGAGKAITGGLWRGIRFAWDAEFAFWSKLPGRILGALAGAGRWLRNLGVQIIGGLYHGITGYWTNTVAPWINDLRRKVVGIIGNAARWLFDKGKAILIGLGDGIVSGAGKVLGWVAGIPGRIIHAIGNVGHLLFDIGWDIMRGLLKGITGGLGKVKDFVGGIGKKIIGWKGPPAKDAVLLVGVGELIMGGLVRGLDRALPKVRSKLAEVTGIFHGARPTLNLDVADVVVPKLAPLEAELGPIAPPKLAPLKLDVTPLPKVNLGVELAPMVKAPAVDPARFATAFRPPPPALTDRPLNVAAHAIRDLEDAAGTAHTGTPPPITQENHFHGHERPTGPEIDYAGRQLQWRIANTGRRP